MTEETRLVLLHLPRGWQFWREFHSPNAPPDAMALMAYTVDANNNYVRRWGIWPHPTAIDGVEDMPADVGQKVAPESIVLNRPTMLATGRVIDSKPKRLIEYWTDYHNTRPIVYEAASLWQRILRALR